MTTPPKPKKLMTLEVLRTEAVTPHMIRVVLGGPGLADYGHNAFTDRYVKLIMPPEGVTYPEPLDPEAIRRDFPPEHLPRFRTYTIRSFDPVAGELAIDFVIHGDEGIAGPWAQRARPGDRLHLRGPGGAYAPDPEADWHLVVGDEAAFPAIAAALAEIPAHAPVVAILEAEDDQEAAYLDLPDRAQVRWLLRDRGEGGLAQALAETAFPPGTVHAFVHGELGEVRLLRRHLLEDRGLPLDRLSISGYWRRGKDEDGFQAEKRAESEGLTGPALAAS